MRALQFPNGKKSAGHGRRGVGRPVRPFDGPPSKVQAPVEDSLQVSRHKLSQPG